MKNNSSESLRRVLRHLKPYTGWIILALLCAADGMEEALLEKGVELIPDTCVDEACCWKRLAGQAGVTDSPKASYYMRTFGVQMAVRDTESCIRWAQRGRVE